jgi:hypothetical protein
MRIDKEGMLAIHHAVLNARVEILELMLKHKTVLTIGYQETPLIHLALATVGKYYHC